MSSRTSVTILYAAYPWDTCIAGLTHNAIGSFETHEQLNGLAWPRRPSSRFNVVSPGMGSGRVATTCSRKVKVTWKAQPAKTLLGQPQQ